MKVTLIADIHMGFPNRQDDIIWALNQVSEYNLKNKITTTIILGDLLHDREHINIHDLNLLVELLDDIKNTGQRWIAFPGNHDMYLKNSWDITGMKAFNKHLEYIDKVTKLELGGVNFWVVPFIHSEVDYMEEINKIRPEPNDVLLTHIGMCNASYNSTFLLKNWSVVDLTKTKFHKVYAGHFHCTQKIGSNCYYVGSPIPFKFDEGDVEHGFVVYDTQANSHKFINLWDEVDGYTPPKYLTVDNAKNLTKEQAQGNVIRILPKDYTNHEMDEIRQRLTALGAKNVRFMVPSAKEDKDKTINAKIKVARADELFVEYMKHDENAKELSSPLLIKINAEIINEGNSKYGENSGS